MNSRGKLLGISSWLSGELLLRKDILRGKRGNRRRYAVLSLLESDGLAEISSWLGLDKRLLLESLLLRLLWLLLLLLLLLLLRKSGLLWNLVGLLVGLLLPQVAVIHGCRDDDEHRIMVQAKDFEQS